MIIEDHRNLSWRQVDQRSNRLARHLLAAGLGNGDRVAVCTRNTPACLEAYIACFKVALVPFNVNFRYGVDEVAYLFDNGDARAVVVQQEFLSAVTEAASLAGAMHTIVVVADDSGVDAPTLDHVLVEDVVDYEHVVTSGPAGPPDTAWQRSPDDLVFQYTGGTTGMPKAVMWRQGDLVTLLAGKDAPPDEDRSGVSADIADRLADIPRRSCTIAPLIHGTGLLSQLANFFTGGTSVMLGGRRFDPAQAWDCVAKHAVNVLVIVGDSMARPLLDELDRRSDTSDLSSLKMLTSSGAMFSRPVKEGLLRRLPDVVILDAFGSSEASGLGVSLSTVDNLDATAVFRVGEHARLLTDDGAIVVPGNGVVGRIAMPGCVPVGYHKDPVKSAETYPTIDGVRYSVPGDYVSVDDDGHLTLLGRGSSVINTGGEKVHPEEIEEILKEHPSVVDAACIGVPDERFGSAVCAVVQTAVGAPRDPNALREHVRSRSAGYKVPRHIVFLDDLERHPNGKLDRRSIIDRAEAELDTFSAGSPR